MMKYVWCEQTLSIKTFKIANTTANRHVIADNCWKIN